jgi:aspartate aminotransferase-like enzyme
MHKKLLIPGPTEVSKEILQEQARHLIGHREKVFSDFYSGIKSKLAEFFRLAYDYYPTVTTSSGSLWFDIVGRSIVKENALVCVNGAFSSRFGQAIKSCGKKVDLIEVEWGKAVKTKMLAAKLESKKYDTVVMCHNESSTGVRNPIYEIGDFIRKEYPEIIFAVDSVSSMAGDKILPAEIGCDVIFASSQKCFALPPGLCISVVSDRALERASSVSNRGFYTDLVKIFDFEKKHQTPFTPNISLMYALDKRLDLLLEETYERVFDRHMKMAQYTRSWAKKHFELFPELGFESVTLTCIKNTLKKTISELIEKLAKRGFLISNGYGKLKEKTFRIGHMGEWNTNEIKKVLAIIDNIWELEK